MINRYGRGLHCLAFFLGASLILFGTSGLSSAQTTVFSDDFQDSQGESYTTSGNIGSSDWIISRSGADWGGRIHNGRLELTNTASSSSNVNGWVFASVDATEDFSSGYGAVLDQNTGEVSWSFNMRKARFNPAGFGTSRYGAAFVLAADSRNIATAGKGYAVVLGNTGSPDPVRLVAFENGLQSLGITLSGLIIASSPLDDPGDNFFSVRVTYNPADDSWEMFGRMDGSSFEDPLAGELISVGSAGDDTYTGESLPFTGGYWQGETTPNETAYYDNVTVRVDGAFEPEPMLAVSTESLTGFSYIVGEGPSDPQSFDLSGSNLDGTDVTISTGTDYEVSGAAAGTYQDNLVLPGYDGSSTSIFVRLKEGRDEGQYNGVATISGGGYDSSLFVSLSGEVLPAPAQVAVLTLDGFFEEFDGFLGEGFTSAPDAGQLHSENWRIRGMSDGDGFFGGTHQTGDFARGFSSGGVTTAGTYAFDVGGGLTILGVQPGGTDFTPGTITLRLENQTDHTVDFLDISYDIYTFNDQDRANSFNFAWSVNDVTYTGVPELNYTTPGPADAAPEWVKTERSTRLSGLNLAPGNYIYLQWQSDDVHGSGSRDEFGLTNVSVEIINAVEIAGNDGWRMLSFPVEGVTVADLAAQNQVQGVTGIESFYGASAPDGIETDAPNIYTSYEAGWSAPDNVSDVLEIGKGLIWYLFNNDAGVSTPLPFILAATGASPAGDVSTSLHTSSETVDDGEGGMVSVAFNLLGNPFAADLDISEIADWVDGGALNSSIVQVWKNDEAGWQEGIGHQGEWVLIGGGNNDNKLAAWQGFMVENNDATEIEYPADARTDGATFHKEQKLELKRLVFALEGENEQRGLQTRDAANLVFAEDAVEGWDLLDATQLTPLAGSFATLSFVGERNGLEVLKVQESRPADFEGVFELPVAFQAYNMGGDFTISWEGLADLPADWQLTLVDTRTGARVNLRDADDYRFSYASDSESSREKVVGIEAEMPHIAPLQLRTDADGDDGDGNGEGTGTGAGVGAGIAAGASAGVGVGTGAGASAGVGVGIGARFRLVVNSDPVSSGIPGDVPKELELSQNYPNPFNPTTMISFTVPEQVHVRLTVYDMLGRDIAVLVNEQKGPGSYDVHWDATEFSSGMYLYRIEAGSNTMTRRMTFIK